MAYTLNDNIKNLTPYDPIQGEYEVRLDANESYINLPKEILDMPVSKLLGNGVNRYPDPYTKELISAFCDYYEVDPDVTVTGNGSDELISLIVGTFFSKDDILLTLSNDFSMYHFYGETFGIKTEVFKKEEDLSIDVKKLADYINEKKVKGVIFSNPCNPTSLAISREQMLYLVKSVPDCLVIADEAYMDFYNESVIKDTKNYDNLMVLRTCSKAIGLAAARVGFSVSNKTIATALRSVKSPYNVNTLSQCLATAVLKDKERIKENIKKILKSRDELYKEIIKLSKEFKAIEKVYETCTNFVFIKTDKADIIYKNLLDMSIAVRFMGGFLRITAGSEDENKKVVACLYEILKTI